MQSVQHVFATEARAQNKGFRGLGEDWILFPKVFLAGIITAERHRSLTKRRDQCVAAAIRATPSPILAEGIEE